MTKPRYLMLVLDAKQACLARLMAQRTRGRFELYTAISDLYWWLYRADRKEEV